MGENEKYLLIAKPSAEESNLIYIIQTISRQKINLSLPPHITIFPPFNNKLSTEKSLVYSIRENYIKGKYNSHVTFNRVHYFENSNIVLLRPDYQSSIYLKMLHSNFLINLGDKITTESIFLGEKYIPHITINDSSSDELISIIKSDVSRVPVNISFNINYLYLYKKPGGEQNWRQKAIISLNKDY